MNRLNSKSGFTIIEFIIIVAILGILTSMAIAGWEVLQAKSRYSQVKGNFDAIAKAAMNNYTSSPTHDWAPMVMPGDPPSFAASGEISIWPAAPCPGWVYSWDNFYGVPGLNAIRVSMRRGDTSTIWVYCLEGLEGNCMGDDGWGGSPSDMSTMTSKAIYCNE